MCARVCHPEHAIAHAGAHATHEDDASRINVTADDDEFCLPQITIIQTFRQREREREREREKERSKDRKKVIKTVSFFPLHCFPPARCAAERENVILSLSLSLFSLWFVTSLSIFMEPFS